MAAHNELGKEGGTTGCKSSAIRRLCHPTPELEVRTQGIGHRGRKRRHAGLRGSKNQKRRFIRTPRRRRHKRENTTHCQFGRRLLAQIRHRPPGTLRPYHHRNGRKRASPAKAYRGRLLPAAILTCNTIRIF